MDALIVQIDLAGVRLMHAGDHLHQRGLARAVLAQQRVHFAGTQVQVDTAQRVDAGETLADIGHA